MLSRGWFTESADLRRPGESFSIEVEEVIHRERSKYQDILVFQSKVYGKVLVLNGVVHCTEKDEAASNELMAHIPLFSHKRPKAVLCIGGGDGGLPREISKHSLVDEIHVCEIDERVIEVCKKHLPSQSAGISNPKVEVHIGEPMGFIKEHKKYFDIIITDCIDPTTPGLKEALKPGGIVCCQGEYPRYDLLQIKELLDSCKSLYPATGYAIGSVIGVAQQGLLLAGTDKKINFSEPLRQVSEGEADKMELSYYDSHVHRGCFIWPRYVKKGLRT